MASGGKNLIYGLTDPRSGEIRYVGKSTNGLERAKAHHSQVRNGEKSYKANWIRQLTKLGLDYGIVVLEKTLLPSDLGEAERRWIAELRAGGTKLTNMTDGGDGMPGRSPTAETRRKLSKANEGKKRSPETCRRISESQKGKTMSAEARAKMSIAQKKRPPMSAETRAKMSRSLSGKIYSEERIRKMADGRRGFRHTEEFKEHLRQINLGRKHSAETKAKIAAANSRRVWTEEAKAKVSACHKGKTISEEHRDRISAAMKGHTHNKGKKRSPEHIAKMVAGRRAQAARLRAAKLEVADGTP